MIVVKYMGRSFRQGRGAFFSSLGPRKGIPRRPLAASHEECPQENGGGLYESLEGLLAVSTPPQKVLHCLWVQWKTQRGQIQRGRPGRRHWGSAEVVVLGVCGHHSGGGAVQSDLWRAWGAARHVLTEGLTVVDCAALQISQRDRTWEGD